MIKNEIGQNQGMVNKGSKVSYLETKNPDLQSSQEDKIIVQTTEKAQARLLINIFEKIYQRFGEIKFHI